MTEAFRKDTTRTIRKTLNRFCSILLIVALGVGFFAGVRATGDDMRSTASDYYTEYNAMDLKILSTLGFSDNDVAAVQAVSGVKQVYAGKFTDCLTLCQDNFLTRVFSLPDNPDDPETMNRLRVLEGRLPTAENECAIDQNIMDKYGFSVGQTLKLASADPLDDLENDLKNTEYTIVGMVNSPIYVDMTRRGSTTVGDGSLDAYLYVPEENFTAEYYTELYVTAANADALNCYTDAYDDLVEALRDALTPAEAARSELRMEEMADYLNEKIPEAQKKITDAEAQLADAEQQLTDAANKLADARQQISDGEKQLVDGRAALEAQKKQYEAYEKKYEEGKQELAAAKLQITAAEAMGAQLTAGKAQVNAILGRMENLPAGSPLLPILAGTLAPTLNELTDANGKKLNLGDKLYNESGEVTPETVTATRIAVNSYFADMQRQISSASAQYENGKRELEESRKQLDTYKNALENAEDRLDNGEKELADARVKLAEGEKEFEEKSTEARQKIADGKAALNRGKLQLANAEETQEKLSPAKWYVYSRSDLALGVSEFGDDAVRIDNISVIFPVFFLAVAALVCLTTMARMVEEQRTEIGTLKALGYTDREIQKKYLIYSLSATVLGSVVGLSVGFKLFPTVIYDAYCIMYDLPPVKAPFHWGVAAICVAVALICVTLVTCSVCRGVLKEMPANIMRPKAPPAGQRVLLEKVTFIWKRLSFSHKVTVRNLFRYKKRVLMTIIGIAGCAALVLTGYGLNDAIGDIVTNQFQRVFRYDLLAGYSAEDEATEQALFDQLDSDPAIQEWMPQYRNTVTALGNDLSLSVNLTVSEDYTKLTDFISLQERVSGKVLTPEKRGAIITEKLGTMLDLKAGDTLTLRDSDNRLYEMEITGVSENYASHFVYISAEYYEEIFGKAPEYNSVIVDLVDRDDWKAASEKLLAGGTVQMVASDAEMLEQYINVTDNLGYVVAVLIVSAGLLAFVVQYNLSNINITERTREIATLKVLGFYDREVSAYIYRENIILTILGTAAGLLLGTGLTRFVITTAEIDSIMFGRNIYFPSFLMATLLTFLFSFIVNWVMHYRLKKISMVESMKSVD